MVKTSSELGAGSSSKRRKYDDDDDTESSNKKQRTRVSFSCGECHRRKQKCDRAVPCSHCVARKVPHLCKAYMPGKADQDVNARLSRIEHIIELALPQFKYLPGPPGSPVENRSSSRSRRRSLSEDDTPEDDLNGGTFQSGKWYGNSASGSIAPGSVLEQLRNVVLPGPNPQDTRLADIKPSGSGSSNNIDPALQELEPSAADNLKNLVQECGVSPHKISELLQELPPQRLSDVLIHYYFKSINWTRYPISERDFRQAYVSISAHGAHGVSATNPDDVRFLPLLFVVLAISVRLAPEEIAGDPRTRRVTSLRYYWSSRRSLLIAAAIQPDSLDIVLTRLLSARFLTFDRRITECWSQLGAAVRTAQALGLHRDGATMGGMSSSIVEYRRRIWSYLYHADRSYALVLGRPHSIQDDFTSTLPPSNIEDEDDSRGTIPPAVPLSTPTPMTFVILRHQLASIIGQIVRHFQRVRTSTHYSDVVALDDEILRFIVSLPPHYALEPDKALDERYPYIPVHRFLLITEIFFVRTSLHRPYILRKLNSDRCGRSRIACFESAIKDYQVRQAFRETVSKEVRYSLSNAYRKFQTAMISGIYLVLEPNGKDAAAMHVILDSFLKEHEEMKGEMDETTNRELRTIEFLKARASQRGATGGGENPAQILLSLQQPSSNGLPPLQMRPTFPSMYTLTTSFLPVPQSPTVPFNGQGIGLSSPTFHRISAEHAVAGHSPATSGSPSGEDEAQSLLDNWCNTVDGTTDFSGQWLGGTNGALEPSEWSYWEALVNQIQRAGP